LEQWKQSDPTQVGTVQARVREEFGKWFARGYAAIGFRATKVASAYLLAPWSEF
jgi:hypothetical protein